MRLILPEKDIQEAYPGYNACSALLFSNIWLYVIGEAHGPFKVGKSRDPFHHFHTLCRFSHLDLRLWHMSRIPVGVEANVARRAAALLAGDEIKHDWYGVDLTAAIQALQQANPLGPLVDMKALTMTAMLAMSDDDCMDLGVLPVDKSRRSNKRRK
jgi:hypothetical protein